MRLSSCLPIEQHWHGAILLQGCLLVDKGNGYLHTIWCSGPKTLCLVVILDKASQNRLYLLHSPVQSHAMIANIGSGKAGPCTPRVQ